MWINVRERPEEGLGVVVGAPSRTAYVGRLNELEAMRNDIVLHIRENEKPDWLDYIR
jgi:hypothetical protein